MMMRQVTGSWLGLMFRILKIILILLFFYQSNLFSAIDCDGTDDYFELATSSGLPTGAPVSVGLWIYPDSVTGQHKIIAHGERSGTAKGWSFGTSGDELLFTTHGVKDYLTTSLTIVTGEWQFIGAYLDTAHDVAFYHYRPSTNTLATASVLHGVGMTNPSTGPVTICANDDTVAGNKATFFNGKVEEIFMINAALTQANFEAIFRSRMRYLPAQIGAANLSMYYMLNEHADGTNLDGLTIKDYSNSGNNVTGNDGATNGTLTAKAGEVLSYP